MAFTVEDGTGLSNSNAYVSVSELKAYWADRAVTLAHDDVALESAIIIASQYVDLNNAFKGSIVSASQAMSWPRQNVTDREGRKINSTSVPVQVKNAISEYAKRQLDNADGLQPDVPDKRGVVREKKKVDVIETETQYSADNTGYYGLRRYPLADNYLVGLVKGGIGGNLSKVGTCW